MGKRTIFSHFSTKRFLEEKAVENLPAGNSRTERNPKGSKRTPKKVNCKERLPFGKKEKVGFFSPGKEKIPISHYELYRRWEKLVWKTRWKRWKTMWETTEFFHNSGGKPGGKSEKFFAPCLRRGCSRGFS